MTEYSTQSGEAIADTADDFAHLRVDLIVPSLTNPRKTFDAIKLAELADSIKASGVHQPVLVRPLPGSRLEETFAIYAPNGSLQPRPTHELVAGERRYRACKLAGVATIPALIRQLTDHQVLEIQIIENLQRDDLSALEEAEGYESLCAATGISKEDVGAKIGKSRAYVYGRLKLLDLTQECKEHLRAGTIDTSRALLIARIPDTKLQLKALTEATRADWQGETPSTRTFGKWLQTHVMLRLEDAPFLLGDATLTSAGACRTCPKRTGANPDLFADVASTDICTDPPCYDTKVAAQREAMLATAATKGMRLITGDEAEAICNKWNGTFDGYSPLNQERQDVADGTQPASLGILLGKDGPAPVLIENPWTKTLTACVPTEEAETVLIAKGLVKASLPKGHKREANDIEEEIEHIKLQIEKDTDKVARKAIFAALVTAVHACHVVKATELISNTLLRSYLLSMIGEFLNEDMAHAFGIELAIENDYSADELALRLHIQACGSPDLYRAMVILMIEPESSQSYYQNAIEPTPRFDALSRDLNVNTTEIRSTAKNEVQKATLEKIRTLKTELKALNKAGTDDEKPLSPNAPAAQANASAGGASGQVKSASANTNAAPLRKRKMTAAEAQAEIAAAMQSQETDSGAADASQGNEQAATARPEALHDASEINETLYATATNMVVIQRVASISRLQRVLGIGYNNAACLIERMGEEGIVARQPDGTFKVLAPSPLPATDDPLYQPALDLIQKEKKANVRLLKEGLKVGTSKALELMDMLEQEGHVSPCNERGARAVLVTA
jgi:ParB/RepB/Spo0J family partition protein